VIRELSLVLVDNAIFTIFAVPSHKNSEKQRRNSGRFAVFCVRRGAGKSGFLRMTRWRSL
jgi:hypothetical protein